MILTKRIRMNWTVSKFENCVSSKLILTVVGLCICVVGKCDPPSSALGPAVL